MLILVLSLFLLQFQCSIGSYCSCRVLFVHILLQFCRSLFIVLKFCQLLLKLQSSTDSNYTSKILNPNPKILKIIFFYCSLVDIQSPTCPNCSSRKLLVLLFLLDIFTALQILYYSSRALQIPVVVAEFCGLFQQLQSSVVPNCMCGVLQVLSVEQFRWLLQFYGSIGPYYSSRFLWVLLVILEFYGYLLELQSSVGSYCSFKVLQSSRVLQVLIVILEVYGSLLKSQCSVGSYCSY